MTLIPDINAGGNSASCIIVRRDLMQVFACGSWTPSRSAKTTLTTWLERWARHFESSTRLATRRKTLPSFAGSS